MSFNAFIAWPNAPLSERLVRNSLDSLQVKSIVPEPSGNRLLQWSTYDAIDHDLTLGDPNNVLSSSYIIRKALIRKHFLHRCIQAYVTKHSSSTLTRHVPRTWDVEISFADELEEMWSDDLWELGQELESDGKWYILKPGMADRGNGIRLFNSKESLQEIFESFEGNSDDEEEDADDETAVVMSQLRNFVIQEYLPNPLLLDPTEIPLNSSDPPPSVDALKGHKFHLRAYYIASGALTLYLFPQVLALFSSEVYKSPASHSTDPTEMDLAPHLTNTSLQRERGEEGVRLFDELVGCRILSDWFSSDSQPNDVSDILTKADIEAILDQMADVLAETFRAAIQSPVHFMPLRNAFELYGVDFLITDSRTYDTPNPTRFEVNLLEVNSEPAIELTGPRLTWILEELFVAIGRVCIQPFFSRNTGNEHKEKNGETWNIGETKYGLRKCLEVRVRGAE